VALLAPSIDAQLWVAGLARPNIRLAYEAQRTQRMSRASQYMRLAWTIQSRGAPIRWKAL